jgi:uncharacterized protein YmfQ (DUF2313 family)
MSLFKRRNLEDYTDSLAAYLPGGELFESRSVQNSNFRKLLRGMAGELFRSNGYLKEYNEEILPDQTTKFIGEWEAAVGIPDGCFLGTGDLNTRRRDILTKLASLGVQTDLDFEELALVFGQVVNVFPLSDEMPTSKFTIVVEGDHLVDTTPPYDVPFFLFSSQEILQCLFQRLKPANCSIIFRNT